jgi:hypothetical protein
VAAGQQIPDLTNTAIGAGTIKSVKIGAPCRSIVLLYAKANYHGTYLGLGADEPDLIRYRFTPAAVVNNTGRVVAVYDQPAFSGVCENVGDGQAFPTLASMVVHGIRSVRLSGPCPQAVLLFGQASFNGPFLNVGVAMSNLPPHQFPSGTTSLVNNTNGFVSVYNVTGFLGGCLDYAPGQSVSAVGPRTSKPVDVRSIALGVRCPQWPAGGGR